MSTLARTPSLTVSASSREDSTAAWRPRLTGLLVAVAAAAVLGVAAWLEPSPSGLGTHRQLAPWGAMPACSWIQIMDCPCPTCGMTTAFAHAANGNLWASLRSQPLGCVLALGTAMAMLVGGYVALTGSRVGSMLGRLFDRKTCWWAAGAVLLSWGYKVLAHQGGF